MGKFVPRQREVHEKDETKEAGSQMTEQVEETYAKEALASLQVDKVSKYADRKIDKIDNIDGKPVTPKERKTMKDMAEALAKCDMDGLRKTIHGLDEKTGGRVADGLNEALKDTRIHLAYDRNIDKRDGMHPNIEIVVNDKKVMIPLDGDAPHIDHKDSSYTTHRIPGYGIKGHHVDEWTQKVATAEDLFDAQKALKDAWEKLTRKVNAHGQTKG